jgi:hypothetical protein
MQRVGNCRDVLEGREISIAKSAFGLDSSSDSTSTSSESFIGVMSTITAVRCRRLGASVVARCVFDVFAAKAKTFTTSESSGRPKDSEGLNIISGYLLRSNSTYYREVSKYVY